MLVGWSRNFRWEGLKSQDWAQNVCFGKGDNFWQNDLSLDTGLRGNWNKCANWFAVVVNYLKNPTSHMEVAHRELGQKTFTKCFFVRPLVFVIIGY